MARHDRSRYGAGLIRAIGRSLGLGVAATALIVPAWALPAVAATGNGGPARFGVAPTPLPDGRGRPYFQFDLGPGQSATDAIRIANPSHRSETLKLSPSTGVTAPDSGSAYSDYFRKCVGTGCWIHGLPRRVTVPAGSDTTVSFTVIVPRKLPPKQYLGGITVEPTTKSRPITIARRGNASARVVVVPQASVGVAMTVGSHLTTRLGISSVTGGAVESVPRLFVHVRNPGQTFTKGKGDVSCKVGPGQQQFPVTVNTVLPGDKATVPVNAQPLRGKTVPCTVVLHYGDGQIVRWSGTVSVPGATPPSVVHTGKGVYATVPTGIPTWGTALIGLAGVAVVSWLGLLLWFFLRRRGLG